MDRARRVLASLPRDELLDLLAEAGYGSIELGPYQRPDEGAENWRREEEGLEKTPRTMDEADLTIDDEPPTHMHERHSGRFCQTEVSHHVTVPEGTPLRVLIEEDSSVISTTVQKPARAQLLSQ